MKSNFFKQYFGWIILVATLIFFDQITKWWIRKNFSLYEEKILTSFLAITYTTNTGIVFGFLSGANEIMIFVITTILLIVVSMLKTFSVSFGKFGILVACLIISGGIGNLIDRILLGKVTDFIDLRWNYKNIWPVFNLADSYVFIGMCLIVLKSVFKKHKKV